MFVNKSNPYNPYDKCTGYFHYSQLYYDGFNDEQLEENNLQRLKYGYPLKLKLSEEIKFYPKSSIDEESKKNDKNVYYADYKLEINPEKKSTEFLVKFLDFYENDKSFIGVLIDGNFSNGMLTTLKVFIIFYIIALISIIGHLI